MCLSRPTSKAVCFLYDTLICIADKNSQDKTTADILDGLNRFESRWSRLEDGISSISKAVTTISRKLESMKRVISNLPNPEALKYPPTAVAPDASLVVGPDGPDPLLLGGLKAPIFSQPNEPPFPSSDEEAEEEDDEGDEPVNPGQSSIPVNLTTGAARLLLVRPISRLARGIIVSDRIKNEKYPMLQEERRGLLRLYGRGEGTERLPGYDRDQLTDHAYDGSTPSDTSSEVRPHYGGFL